MVKPKPICALALLATSLCLLAGAGRAADIKVKALMPAKLINEAFSPFSVAKYLGYFTEEGLDVNLIAVGGSNEVALAVSAGAGDVGLASPGQALVGMQSPASLDLKFFYEANYRSVWSVTVKPDSPIQSIKELKGKKVGMAAMGSAAVTFGKALAVEAGLDPVKDISFIAVGSGAQAVGALNHDAVDALIFSTQETNKFEANEPDDPANVLSEKFTLAYSLTGTPDECVARAMDYADAGIDELALTFDGVAATGDIALLGGALKHHLPPTAVQSGSTRLPGPST